MLANHLVLGSLFAAVLAVLAWPLVRATTLHENAAKATALAGLLALACGYLAFLGESVALGALAGLGLTPPVSLAWRWSPHATLLALWVATLWCTSYWASLGSASRPPATQP
jgi:formate hydrogenlyase subunit 3/multisubunit Na+/H+ antiporter MnhD subunit